MKYLQDAYKKLTFHLLAKLNILTVLSVLENDFYQMALFISFLNTKSPLQLIKPINLIDNLFRLIDQFRLFWETYNFYRLLRRRVRSWNEIKYVF